MWAAYYIILPFFWQMYLDSAALICFEEIIQICYRESIVSDTSLLYFLNQIPIQIQMKRIMFSKSVLFSSFFCLLFEPSKLIGKLSASGSYSELHTNYKK